MRWTKISFWWITTNNLNSSTQYYSNVMYVQKYILLGKVGTRALVYISYPTLFTFIELIFFSLRYRQVKFSFQTTAWLVAQPNTNNLRKLPWINIIPNKLRLLYVHLFLLWIKHFANQEHRYTVPGTRYVILDINMSGMK